MRGKFLCRNILRDSEGKGGGNILIENSPLFLLHFCGETTRMIPRNFPINLCGNMGEVDALLAGLKWLKSKSVGLHVRLFHVMCLQPQPVTTTRSAAWIPAKKKTQYECK